MAAGQGNKIEWTDYNAIQSVIAPVLGATATGSGSTGYGQSVASSQVTQYAKITNTQWANLRTDILRARQHQTGTDLSSTLAVPYFDITITQTAINTNLLTTGTTSQLAVNSPIIFVGDSLLGGVQTNYTYYVKTIESATTFTISSNQGGGVFTLSTGIGSMICRFGGTKITETDRAAYKALADLASTNKLTGATGASALPATQSTRETLYNDSYLNAWNGVLTVTSTVQFTSYDAARYFFNARGQLELFTGRNDGSGGLKNATWTTMLDSVAGMGIVYFSYNTTVNKLTNGNTGSGSPQAVGFYNLTTSDILIFERLAPSGAYADNKFRIYAKLTDGNAGPGSNACIQFTLEWRDDSLNPNPTTYGPYGPFGVDETVDGRITSVIQMLRPTGSNVSIPTPTIGIANNFVVTPSGSNAISYTLTPNVSTTNEGTTISYTVTTTNLPNGTVVYYTNSGSTQAADFVDGVNSGSITINSNTASFSRSVSNDVLTEGPESVQIVLRTGSTSGPLVASSTNIIVNDTSLTGITYQITASQSGTQPEGTGALGPAGGTAILYTVTTANFGTGVLWWENIGTTIGEDFTDGQNSGTVPINNNSGSFTRVVKKDEFTDGSSETVTITLRTSGPSGTLVATSPTITITDSSTTVPPIYTFSSNQFTVGTTDTVSEGTEYLIYVDTNEKVPSSPIYWLVSGGLTTADLSLTGLSGGLGINPGSRSTLRMYIRADNLTEGQETGYIRFYSDPSFSTPISSLRTIVVTDSSINLSISPASLNAPTSGSNYSANFSASNGSGIYSYSCTSGNLPVGLTLDTGGNLSGTVITAGSYSFTITARDSNNALGSRSYSGNITANETVTAPTQVNSTTKWYYRFDYGIPNGIFTINGSTNVLDARGTYWALGDFGGSTGTATFTIVFNGSGTTRVVTIQSV
jgi:hypothetical protein